MAVVDLKPSELTELGPYGSSAQGRGLDGNPYRTNNYIVERLLAIDPRPNAPYEGYIGRGVDSGYIRPTAQQISAYKKALSLWNARKPQRESAQRFALDLIKTHTKDFLGTRANLSKVMGNFSKSMARDVEVFKSKYSNEDVTWLGKGAQAASDSLTFISGVTTPAPKGKLFGFIPIRVTPALQSFIGVSVGAAASFAAPAIGAASQVSTPAAVGSDTIITGAPFLVNTPGGGSVTGFLSNVPGSLTTYVPQASFLVNTPGSTTGITQFTVNPVAEVQPSVVGQVGSWSQKQIADVKASILENPVKSAVGGAGLGFTLKRISESSNPLAALVNTVAGAVGLPPIINPGPGATGGKGPNPYSGFFGSGGGGGGSSSSLTSMSTLSSSFLWIGLIVGVILLIVKARS